MRHVFIVAVALGLAACASDPDKIAAGFVSPVTYANYDCKQIAGDLSLIEPRLGEAMDSQRHRRQNDAVSWALIGITPTMLNGDEGQEALIADLKGKRDALRAEGVRKGCDIPPVNLDQYSAARTYIDPKTGETQTFKDGKRVE
jgi:hypothetical protein